jgi:hypothetical protein
MVMNRTARVVVLLAVVVGIGLAATSMLADAGWVSTAADERCCFTNPRYTGVCVVTPAEDESCGSILAYLNNPNSVGKPYCGGTTIRGGWAQVECKE